MRLAPAQIDTVVGDLDGNRDKIVGQLEQARAAGSDLVLFPELAVTGYPPEDLLLRPGFIRAAERSLAQLAEAARDIVALVGTPHFDGDLYNACAICSEGEVKAFVRKRFLPNYGVFDEDRYFAPGRDLVLLRLGETLIGPTVCEDLWQPGPPATDLALAGAQLIANISASPRRCGTVSRSSAARCSTATSRTRAPSAPKGRSRPSTVSSSSPTTASSTRIATSRRDGSC